MLGHYEAVIHRVVDGDTVDCTITIFPDLKLENQRLRLLGINTAELKSHDVSEKARAVRAKEYVDQKLKNKTVVIKTIEKDVFGRHLVTLYLDGEDFNQHLLDKKIAKVYVRGENSRG